MAATAGGSSGSWSSDNSILLVQQLVGNLHWAPQVADALHITGTIRSVVDQLNTGTLVIDAPCCTTSLPGGNYLLYKDGFREQALAGLVESFRVSAGAAENKLRKVSAETAALRFELQGMQRRVRGLEAQLAEERARRMQGRSVSLSESEDEDHMSGVPVSAMYSAVSRDSSKEPFSNAAALKEARDASAAKARTHEELTLELEVAQLEAKSLQLALEKERERWLKSVSRSCPQLPPADMQDEEWAVDQTIQLGRYLGEELGWAKRLDKSTVVSTRQAVQLLNSGLIDCPGDFCIVFSASSLSYNLLYRGGTLQKAYQLLVEAFVEISDSRSPKRLQLPSRTNTDTSSRVELEDARGMLSTLQGQLLEAADEVARHKAAAQRLGQPTKEAAVQTSLPIPTRSARSVDRPETETPYDSASETDSVLGQEWAIDCALALGTYEGGNFDRAPLLDPQQVASCREAVQMLNAGEIPDPGDFCVVFSESSLSYYLLYKKGLRDEAVTKIVERYPFISRSAAALAREVRRLRDAVDASDLTVGELRAQLDALGHNGLEVVEALPEPEPELTRFRTPEAPQALFSPHSQH